MVPANRWCFKREGSASGVRGGGVDGTGVGLPPLGDDDKCDGLEALTLDTDAVGDGADDGERRCFVRCVLQNNSADVTCHELSYLTIKKSPNTTQ